MSQTIQIGDVIIELDSICAVGPIRYHWNYPGQNTVGFQWWASKGCGLVEMPQPEFPVKNIFVEDPGTTACEALRQSVIDAKGWGRPLNANAPAAV